MAPKKTHLQNRNRLTDKRTELWLSREARKKRDEMRVWAWQVPTIPFRMRKQQGLVYSIANYIKYPGISHNGKIIGKKKVYMCITELVCCVAKIQTVPYINYTSSKKLV